MSENTKIEWCDHSANIWIGCAKVHSGCDNCYAEAFSNRFGMSVWGNDNPRRLVKSFFKDLKTMQEKAKKVREVHTVFVGSLMDIFEKPMPVISNTNSLITYNDGTTQRHATTDDFRQVFFEGISNGEYNNLRFLLLTKRPSNINKYIPASWLTHPPKNVMFGTSISTQETADTLIPQLLTVKGKKFLSVEPQLEFIRIGHYLSRNPIDWVIQGGESGSKRRPFDLIWAYSMKIQCEANNVPYFFKQIDKVKDIPDDLLNSRKFPIF